LATADLAVLAVERSVVNCRYIVPIPQVYRTILELFNSFCPLEQCTSKMAWRKKALVLVWTDDARHNSWLFSKTIFCLRSFWVL
jgi:hypothetical protein